MSQPLAAVIFDLDGTLVNSESLTWRVFTELWNELEDSPMPPGLKDEFRGLRVVQRVARLQQMLPLKTSAEQWLMAFNQRFDEAHAREGIPAMPGADRLLRQLLEVAIPVGLATNSGTEYVTQLLAEKGWSDLFATVAVRQDVERLKPFPDLYLHALKNLNVTSDEAVAVEDSSVGVESAAAAGLFVVGVAASNLAGSSYTVASLEDITPTRLRARFK